MSWYLVKNADTTAQETKWRSSLKLDLGGGRERRRGEGGEAIPSGYPSERASVFIEDDCRPIRAPCPLPPSLPSSFINCVLQVCVEISAEEAHVVAGRSGTHTSLLDNPHLVDQGREGGRTGGRTRGKEGSDKVSKDLFLG